MNEEIEFCTNFLHLPLHLHKNDHVSKFLLEQDKDSITEKAATVIIRGNLFLHFSQNMMPLGPLVKRG